MTLNDAFYELVVQLEVMSACGDDHAARCLAAMELLSTGWRYGDPDPDHDGDDPGGGEVIPFRRAA